MIKVRVKGRPDEVVTYPSRKHIKDLEHWGLILEVVHDDDAPVRANDNGSVLPEPEVFVNDSEPEDVWTLEQVEELYNESSWDRGSEDERE